MEAAPIYAPEYEENLPLLLVNMELYLLLVLGIIIMHEEREQRKQEEAATRRRQRRARQEITRKITRTVWVRPWLLRRPLYGQYEKLMEELLAEDVASFKNFLRVDPGTFQEILDRVGPRIQKEDTFFRKALEPGLKLAITLRYLATGNSYKSLQYGFRVAFNTISLLVIEVCDAIIEEYSSQVMVCPTNAETWRQVADGFKNRWNFPHCIGAIDGKHVAIRCPRKAGSEYFNYKGFHSIVLLALVDSDYKFLFVDIGATGAGSDGGVFSETELREAFEEGTLGLPEPDPLPYDDRPMPYFIVGDDAFALKPWLMKPLPHRSMAIPDRVFNYRLSRARRVVENAFGLLASRFRCLLTTMPQSPERVSTITLACCVLHNFLRSRNPTLEANAVDQENPDSPEIIPGAWRENANLPDLGQAYRGNTNRAAKEQRQYLVHYVNSEAGSVPWQLSKI